MSGISFTNQPNTSFDIDCPDGEEDFFVGQVEYRRTFAEHTSNFRAMTALGLLPGLNDRENSAPPSLWTIFCESIRKSIFGEPAPVSSKVLGSNNHVVKDTRVDMEAATRETVMVRVEKLQEQLETRRGRLVAVSQDPNLLPELRTRVNDKIVQVNELQIYLLKEKEKLEQRTEKKG